MPRSSADDDLLRCVVAFVNMDPVVSEAVNRLFAGHVLRYPQRGSGTFLALQPSPAGAVRYVSGGVTFVGSGGQYVPPVATAAPVIAAKSVPWINAEDY